MAPQDDQPLVRQYLEALRAGADFRDRKVRRLRAAIRAGAFENQLKVEVADDRLVEELLEMEARRSGMTKPETRITNP